MKRAEIEHYLRALGEKLDARGLTGDILIVGGAYMLLVLSSRDATRDIDAYFVEEGDAIRTMAADVAVEHGLPTDWLNDAVKGFIRQRPERTDLWRSYPGLNIYTPDPAYVFAMKAEASRVGTSDIADLEVLIRVLELRTVEEALRIVERFIPARLRSMRTQLTLEAIFEGIGEMTEDPPPTWVAIRLAPKARRGVGRKAHIASPNSDRTWCGRPIRHTSESDGARTNDPRGDLGPELCSVCEGAWRSRLR